MNLCSSGHEEIVYDERHCPLCERLEEIKDLKNKIEELKERENE